MYTLTKTHFYGSDAFRIEFDGWECFSSFGPFFDILKSYAEETEITPKRIQLIYQYQFFENGRKTEFYWDGNFAIYVFNIASSQYQIIHDRLKKICADLNRRIREDGLSEKRVEPSFRRYSTLEEIENLSIFKLYGTKEKNVLEIVFEDWESVSGFGPYYDVLQSYSKEAGIISKKVTKFFNYLFVEDGYNIQLHWDAVSTIYVYYIAPEQYRMIYCRLKKICADLNRQIRERMLSEIRRKTTYREPPHYYRDRHKRQ